MKELIIKVLKILLAIAVVVGLYYGVIWVLSTLGVNIPANILTVIFVILGLATAIAVLQGRFDNLF